jgi:DNA-binding CsgD family transcriptional regulator
VAYRIVRPDGEVRHLRTALAVAERRDGKPYRLVGFVEDLTECERARRVQAAQSAFARATSGWRSFEHDGHGLLTGLAVALDCRAAILWLPFKREMAARLVWRDSTAHAAILDSVRPGSRLRRDDGHVWRAWSSRGPASAPTAVAIPAVCREEGLALLELRSGGPFDASEPLMHCFRQLGDELGRVLDEHRDDLDMPAVTRRELEVLQLAATGYSAREIAEYLVIGNSTVTTHFENLYPKLGVSDRAAAVAAALRLGLID